MITCTRCGDEDGPFSSEPDGPVCEGCLNKQDGGQ